MFALIFSTILLKTFTITRIIPRVIIINSQWSSCEVPIFLWDFNRTWIFSPNFRKIFKYQISWKSFQGIRVVPCGRTDTTELIVAIRNTANAPKDDSFKVGVEIWGSYGGKKPKSFGSSEMLWYHETSFIFTILCFINEISLFPETSVTYSLCANLHVITSQKNAVDYNPVSLPTTVFRSLRMINSKMMAIFIFACNTGEISSSRKSKRRLLYLGFDSVQSVRILLTCLGLRAVWVFREERNNRKKSCRGIYWSKDLPLSIIYIATQYEEHVLHRQS
jgi:hypothetical protein